MLRRLALLFALVPLAEAQVTLYVDASAGPGGDGFQWSTAVLDLQEALDLARLLPTVEEIRVAEGVYLPDRGTQDRSLRFELVSGVRVLGGYPAGGGARDPERFATVLSGDLLGDDGAPDAVGWIAGWTENTGPVVLATSLGPGTELDGIHVRGGNADGFGFSSGGGLRVDGGEIVVRGCAFERCYSSRHGGGAIFVDCVAQVEGSRFTENRADSSGGGAAVIGDVEADWSFCTFQANVGGSGCGLAWSTPTWTSFDAPTGRIEHCRFEGGRGHVGANAGGGVYLRRVSGAAVEDCVFVDNEVNGGGGVYVQAGDARIERCTFLSNRVNGDGGGAVYVENFQDEPILGSTLRNNLMAGNTGALGVVGASVEVVHDTWADNLIPGVGPGLQWPAAFVGEGTLTLRHTLVWGHEGASQTGDAREHFVVFTGGAVSFEECLIEDWAGALPGTAIGADPEFVDRDGEDDDLTTVADNVYELAVTSPAVDAAFAASLPPASDLDAWRRARSVDGDGQGGAVRDIGALERIGVESFGAPYCTVQPTASAGSYAPFLSVVGSDVVLDHDAALRGDGLPPQRFTLGLAARESAFVPILDGGFERTLCLGGNIGRLLAPGQLVLSDAAGLVSIPLDLTSLPTPHGTVAAQAGEVWTFQLWCRDSGPTGTAGSRFSSAVHIVWR